MTSINYKTDELHINDVLANNFPDLKVECNKEATLADLPAVWTFLNFQVRAIQTNRNLINVFTGKYRTATIIKNARSTNGSTLMHMHLVFDLDSPDLLKPELCVQVSDIHSLSNCSSWHGYYAMRVWNNKGYTLGEHNLRTEYVWLCDYYESLARGLCKDLIYISGESRWHFI